MQPQYRIAFWVNGEINSTVAIRFCHLLEKDKRSNHSKPENNAQYTASFISVLFIRQVDVNIWKKIDRFCACMGLREKTCAEKCDNSVQMHLWFAPSLSSSGPSHMSYSSFYCWQNGDVTSWQSHSFLNCLLKPLWTFLQLWHFCLLGVVLY